MEKALWKGRFILISRGCSPWVALFRNVLLVWKEKKPCRNCSKEKPQENHLGKKYYPGAVLFISYQTWGPFPAIPKSCPKGAEIANKMAKNSKNTEDLSCSSPIKVEAVEAGWMIFQIHYIKKYFKIKISPKYPKIKTLWCNKTLKKTQKS